MSRFRRVEIYEPEPFYGYCPPSLLFTETSIFAPPKTLALTCFFEEPEELSFALDLLTPKPKLNLFDSVTDLIQVETTTTTKPVFSSYKRIHRRVSPELYLQSLCDRVSALESKFDRLAPPKKEAKKEDRRYKWTAEIESPEKNGIDRKYKLTADIKAGGKKEYRWTAELKGKGESAISRKYSVEAVSGGDDGDCSKLGKKKDKKKKGKKEESDTRVVEIEEPCDHGAIVLRQAFAKRVRASTSKGKRKDLSPQDAAMVIQMTFRAYLIRRSQALRALRDLAVAKSKLKEIRALFNNFSYRRHISSNAEERQRFTERIIVLLLTVDAIEGADLMVRAAKRSMVDELEAMLDVVDPQPTGRSLSMRRRTFDMPDGVIQKEIAAGVSQVVQMINNEESGSTFEACV